LLSQAVILCGGLGTRLGELTASTPMPMLTVGGRPFIEHLIQEIARFGVGRITLLAGRFGEQIRDLYDGRAMYGSRIEVLVEPVPMGTGEALRYAAGRLEPVFLLMNGDSWIDADLVSLARHWQVAKAADARIAAQLLLQQVADARRFGTVILDKGKVIAFREKSPSTVGPPGSGLINAGVYILERDALGLSPSGQANSLEGEILPALVAEGRVSGEKATEGAYFVNVGIPGSYCRAQRELIAQRTKPALFLDRDGTLNVDRGYTYRCEDLVWQPGAREAVRFANQAGYYVFVVTNQSGVARGLFNPEDVKAFHAAMQTSLFEMDAHIDAMEWCPHHIDGLTEQYRKHCRRRKPSPGMIEDLAAAWPVDMSRSLMIGDSETDMLAASAAGIAGVRYNGGSLLDLVRRYIGRG